MVHVNDAGVASVPFTSVARTWKVWLPSSSDEYDCGLAHAENAAPSSAHWNVPPLGVDVNVKVALVLVVGAVGPHAIVVSGGAAVTVQAADAGVGSGPPALTAATWNVWVPPARPV